MAGVSQFEVPSGLKAGGKVMMEMHQGDTLMNLLKLIGEAYRLQSMYHC